ncbi:MAG: tetratricopeptide repeat protein [Sphingomicrobium sp.]
MPATASVAASADPARTYVRARVAAMNGDHSDAAELLSALSSRRPGETELRSKALAEALGAGRMDLAIPAARAFKPEDLGSDARMLLVADLIKRGRIDAANTLLAVKGEVGDLAFLSPLVNAWSAAERKDFPSALEIVDQLNPNSLLGPFKSELKAFILIKSGNTTDAEAFARRAIGNAGSRELKVRLSLADAFLAAGDKARAELLLDGLGGDGYGPGRALRSGKQLGIKVDSLPKAMSEVIAALAADVARRQRGIPPFGLVQVSRYLDPDNSSATALMAVLLETRNRHSEALSLLRAIPAGDPLSSPIRDLETQILIDSGDLAAALRIASAAAAAPGAGPADLARLGNVQSAMERFDEAARSFEQAVALAGGIGVRDEIWPLHLLRADALSKANRWDDVKRSLNAALEIAPDQPLILNYLGYAKLERGEDLDAAEALIRKASELSPDDASIIDSLGWAQFKRGRVDEAIDTLQRAASKDPAQADIHEHLGDALFTSGRRVEARFAWTAALITAEDDIARRVRAKIDHGLTKANAAP